MKKSPALVFQAPFDERCAFETKSRGYLGPVEIRLSDGSRYTVTFWDAVRLQQDLETEVSGGVPYIAEPGMIVVESVTLENMLVAVDELQKQGFFSHLVPRHTV